MTPRLYVSKFRECVADVPAWYKTRLIFRGDVGEGFGKAVGKELG